MSEFFPDRVNLLRLGSSFGGERHRRGNNSHLKIFKGAKPRALISVLILITVRATSTAFISQMASFTSARAHSPITISPSCNIPCR